MKTHRIYVKDLGIVELECFEHPCCPGCIIESADKMLDGGKVQEYKKQCWADVTLEQKAEFDRKWKNKKLIIPKMD